MCFLKSFNIVFKFNFSQQQVIRFVCRDCPLFSYLVYYFCWFAWMSSNKIKFYNYSLFLLCIIDILNFLIANQCNTQRCLLVKVSNFLMLLTLMCNFSNINCFKILSSLIFGCIFILNLKTIPALRRLT